MSRKRSQETSLAKKVRSAVRDRPAGEHVLNVVKAGLASFPAGASIASLLTDYIPSQRHKRLEEFVERLGNDLKRLSDRIDADYVKSESFAPMVEQCLRGVADQPQQEKREAFRAILLNSAIDSSTSSDEKDFYLALVKDLTGLHLRILSFLVSPRRYLQSIGRTPESMTEGRSFDVIMQNVFYPVPLDVIRSAFGDLHRRGLVNTDEGVFSTMTSSQGLALVGEGTRVTAFGLRFIQFCTVPQ
jgi:hypothetical protein